MTWIKIDDTLPEHPKVLSAPPMAGWLFVCGLCYCNRNLTDGFIPRRAALRLVDAGHDEVLALIEGLVEAGLWVASHDGFQVHDYLGHQRSAAQITRNREGARARKQLQRSREAVTQLSLESHSVTTQVTDSHGVTSPSRGRDRDRERERDPDPDARERAGRESKTRSGGEPKPIREIVEGLKGPIAARIRGDS